MADLIKNFINVGLSGWFFGIIPFFILIYSLLKKTTKNRRKNLAQTLAPIWQQNNDIYLDKPSESNADYYDLACEDKGEKWRSRVKQIMIPNHEKIISLCKNNYNSMNSSEIKTFKEYEDHVASFKSYHQQGTKTWKMFPNQITNIFKD